MLKPRQAAAILVLIGAALTAGLITYFRKWRYLWTEWLTSVDHKHIGIMYIVIAFVMLARADRGRADAHAAGLRSWRRFPVAASFWAFFTTHGTIMIFACRR